LCARGCNQAAARGPSTSPLKGRQVPDVLVYQTYDPNFADRVVETMTAAGISSYRTARGYADLRPGIDLGTEVCIFIRREEDYSRANEILRDLGAATDEPVKLPSRRVLFLLVFVVTLVAVLVAVSW
jgi:hypothetical protein